MATLWCLRRIPTRKGGGVTARSERLFSDSGPFSGRNGEETNGHFTLERFAEGGMIDEKGAGPYAWAH